MRFGYKASVGIIFAALFLLSILTFSSYSAGKQLQIYAVDKNIAIIDEIQEGKEFGVYVVDSDDPSHYPLSDLTIHFNGAEYYVDEGNPDTYPICYLTAPEVNEDTEMQITAEKEGFNDGYLTISVLNIKRLLITPSAVTVKSGSTFELTVTDDDGNPVSNVMVNFTISGTKTYTLLTDENGAVTFMVPSVEKETVIYITASKKGYESTTIQGTIEAIPTSFPEYLIPLIGVTGIVLFLFAGIIRHVRRNEDSGKSGRDFRPEIVRKISPSGEMERRRVMSKENKEIKGSVRIEEIVVGTPELNIGEEPTKDVKKITPPLKLPEEKREKIDTKPDTWVVGTDAVIAKIDRKIGGSSRPKIDVTKWFTGQEEIIQKVDEKIKQYDRRKKRGSKKK